MLHACIAISRERIAISISLHSQAVYIVFIISNFCFLLFSVFSCSYRRMDMVKKVHKRCSLHTIQRVLSARPHFCEASISLPSSNICNPITKLRDPVKSSRAWCVMHVIRGYHVYKDVWVSYTGEMLQCRQ